MSFADAHLLSSLLEGLKELEISQPTEIQASTLGHLLRGHSLLGVSETGSGKTLAYVLPMLHTLKVLEEDASAVEDAGRPRGLVVVPGRELGEQVAKVFRSLTHSTRLRVRSVLGGSRKRTSRQSVAGLFEIVIATPGRLMHLLEAGDLRLDDVRQVVFDEADQMVDPGFLPTARRLISECPDGVQVVLFTATLPGSLQEVVDDLFEKPPITVRTSGSDRLVPTLVVDNRTVHRGHRFPLLEELLLADRETGTLLFGNSRAQCDTIADWVTEIGVPFVVYRGQMERQERRMNLRRFRAGEVPVLITTDLGGRGLDIAHVGRVVNVYLPRDVNNYMHRVGRTARAGRAGLVVNLVTDRDAPLMTELSRRTAQTD
jgi:superfamily II DNA/RNA helicase